MASKKTLYEILDVPANASYADVRLAHDRQVKALEAQQVLLGREEFELQSRLVRVAFTTLSTPLSRDAYDAHLTIRKEPAAAAPFALVPMDKPDAVSLRADAMVLRAEAMALRADALALKAEVASGHFETLHKPVGHFIPPILLASSRTVMLTVGTVAAVAMVIKLLFLFAGNRQTDDGGKLRSQAEDKLITQEYFQAHGVRPANRAEVELLEANRRREEAVQRKVEEDKRRTEDNERRFTEESRRRGDQVSAELQFAEERARQARQEDKRQELERQEEKRRDATAERERIEAERARWREILITPSNPR